MSRQELNFLELIQGFRRGDLLADADRKFGELIQAVAETGSSGTFTLSLSVKMNKAGQIEIMPDAKTKKPQRSIGTGIYFATDDGRLTRRDPNQTDFDDELERRRSVES